MSSSTRDVIAKSNIPDLAKFRILSVMEAFLPSTQSSKSILVSRVTFVILGFMILSTASERRPDPHWTARRSHLP